MMYYPVMLDLSGKKVVVVGGGAVALRKVRELLEAGGLVTAIAPELHRDLEALARDAAGLTLHRRGYERGDLEGAVLVFSATDDQAVNRAVFTEAEEKGIFINAVDDPENCSFIVPSAVRRGDLVVAVSTSGASPSMAAKIRKELESHIPPDIEHVLRQLRRARELLKNDADFAHLSSAERGKIVITITSSDEYLKDVLSADACSSLKRILQRMM